MRPDGPCLPGIGVNGLLDLCSLIHFEILITEKDSILSLTCTPMRKANFRSYFLKTHTQRALSYIHAIDYALQYSALETKIPTFDALYSTSKRRYRLKQELRLEISLTCCETYRVTLTHPVRSTR